LVALHLGAGTPAKQWPVERYAQLADRLVQARRATIVLVGGAEDAPLIQEFCQHAGAPPLVAAGSFSVPQTAALLRRCALFVGNDSGPAHLAAAAECPTLVIFSGTNTPEQWRPWGQNVVCLQEKPECAPCGLGICRRDDHACLTRITVDRVLETIDTLWPTTPRPFA
jgi:ADP-heptose:LPS heptosyltransferase